MGKKDAKFFPSKDRAARGSNERFQSKKARKARIKKEIVKQEVTVSSIGSTFLMVFGVFLGWIAVLGIFFGAVWLILGPDANGTSR